MIRCKATHPSYPEVRCEEPKGHSGDHFHSFYMRAWDNVPTVSPFVRRARAGELPPKVYRG